MFTISGPTPEDAPTAAVEYTEMRGVADMPYSLNTIVSVAHRLRRPPSLSESFAWTPENVQRARRNAGSTQTLDGLLNDTVPTAPAPAPEPTPTPPPRPWEHAAVHIVLKLLFHITLISIFESVFFFLYVSDLENAGLQTTVSMFIGDAVQVCQNFTSLERDVVNAVLDAYINATQVIAGGNRLAAQRAVQNAVLNNQSWIYVGALSGAFVLTTLLARLRKIPIVWGPLLLENCTMVALLAVYEYMFFSTVIFPFQPLSGQEIARNAVEDLHAQCGLFVY